MPKFIAITPLDDTQPAPVINADRITIIRDLSDHEVSMYDRWAGLGQPACVILLGPGHIIYAAEWVHEILDKLQ